MLREPNFNLWNEGIKVVSRCPLCDSPFENLDTRILGEDNETRLLHIRCQKCSNAILALILISQGGISSVGLVTDLSYEDVLRFHKRQKITTNDVSDVHQALEAADFLIRL
jgi:hypothetical protein